MFGRNLLVVVLSLCFAGSCGRAAKQSAKNGIAWEINELTGQRLLPELKEKWHGIYEIALEAGVKLVYGSDAHEPAAMGKFVFAEYILSKLPRGSLSTLREILEWKKIKTSC